ncbi:MAG: HlyD family type I secretion periplasmic adaptor subunit [Gammaproteobacteria bacterium]|nr:HlyD family type I secretion periplasmic adaptor subunit [Gammaproteobacteria bacterium]
MTENKQLVKKKPCKLQFDRSAIGKERLEREDIDFIADSRAAVLVKSTPLASIILYSLLAFIIIAFIWAKFGKLDEVTRGVGKVVPSSHVQIIQNLEGGILARIYVHEGDLVKKGQKLAQLDETRFTAQYREAHARYLALLVAATRLTAEVASKNKIEFPQAVFKDKALVVRERALFVSRRMALQHALRNLRKNYRYAQHELNIIKPLVKEGVMSKIELLRIQRDVVAIKHKIDTVYDGYHEKAQTELTRTRADLSVITEKLAALKDQKVRTTVRSAIIGVIKQIYINTLGGVVKPGMPIMEVVPLNDKLLIEARIKPADIAFIKAGQKALIKITAYDYAIYGGVKARVITVSADTSVDERGNSYYEVTLKTDKNYLGKKKGVFPIIPGMTASVDILTGKKSVLSYLLKPILRAREKALRER